jgi:hypothetical protein
MLKLIIREIHSRRTMKLYHPYLFMHKQKWVHIYKDKFGVKYLAKHRWDIGRVKMINQ